MKKFLITLAILLSSFSLVSAENNQTTSWNWQNQEQNKWWENEAIPVRVTQPIPWVSCSPTDKWIYTCMVWKKTSGTLQMINGMINWLAFIAWTAWVLAIVICGIMYSMWWADQGLKESAKKWITQIIIWLILLFSSGYILQLVAPWVYK